MVCGFRSFCVYNITKFPRALLYKRISSLKMNIERPSNSGRGMSCDSNEETERNDNKPVGLRRVATTGHDACNVTSKNHALSTTEWKPPMRKAHTTSAIDIAYDVMSLEEKRTHYACGGMYLPIDDIPPWAVLAKVQSPKPIATDAFEARDDLNLKVSILQYDITRLEVDAIVNAANESLLGGGGVDGAIHRAAGRQLRDQCRLLNGCTTGDAKTTLGHALPARHVIHTVGPVGEQPGLLQSCYERCLLQMARHQCRAIAFPCISTGVFGYPNEPAANIALNVIREFLENHPHAHLVDRIIVCCFLDLDFKFYKSLMLTKYFPVAPCENPEPATADSIRAAPIAPPRARDAAESPNDLSKVSPVSREIQSPPVNPFAALAGPSLEEPRRIVAQSRAGDLTPYLKENVVVAIKETTSVEEAKGEECKVTVGDETGDAQAESPKACSLDDEHTT